jgi:hypothetical protein
VCRRQYRTIRRLLRPLSLLALFLMAYFFVLRPIQKQALGAGVCKCLSSLFLPAPGPAISLRWGQAAGGPDSTASGQLKEQTIEMIKQKPTDTTRAVQAWLREETS